jgi:hypothetical protein
LAVLKIDNNVCHDNQGVRAYTSQTADNSVTKIVTYLVNQADTKCFVVIIVVVTAADDVSSAPAGR